MMDPNSGNDGNDEENPDDDDNDQAEFSVKCEVLKHKSNSFKAVHQQSDCHIVPFIASLLKSDNLGLLTCSPHCLKLRRLEDFCDEARRRPGA